MNTKILGFDLITEFVGGNARKTTRFFCAKCPATIDIKVGTRALSPDYQASLARSKGWEADGDSKSRYRCPVCRRNKAPTPDPKPRALQIAPSPTPNTEEPTARPPSSPLPSWPKHILHPLMWGF